MSCETRNGARKNNNINLVKSIENAKNYFGISEEAAKFLCYRSVRSILPKNHPKYLKFDLQLQNAIISLDCCLGVAWNNIPFAEEHDYCVNYGVYINEMPKNKVIKLDTVEDARPARSDWNLVENKRKLKRKSDQIIKSLESVGLILNPEE